MKKTIYFLGAIFCCLFLTTNVLASDLFDNYFSSSVAPTTNPWFQSVWDNYGPNLGDTVKIKMKLVNGKSEVAGAKIRIYQTAQTTGSSGGASCTIWDTTKAELLKEISLPTLSPGQYFTGENSFIIDSTIFKTGLKDVDLNNVFFEVYQPNNNIGLECNYTNVLVKIVSNNLDLEVGGLSVVPSDITLNTPITVKYTIKNNGSEKFVNPNAGVGIERKELNGNSNAAPVRSNLIGELNPGQIKEYSFTLDPKVAFFPWNNGINDSFSAGNNRMRLAIRDNYGILQTNYNNDEVIFNLNITGSKVPTASETTSNIPAQTVKSVETALVNGTVFKSPLHTSVYYYENGTRRPFVNSAVYYTWFSNFSDVKNLSVSEVEAIKLGNPMPIKAGTKLLKFPLNPKVYEVTEGNTISHVPDEKTATTKFGIGWNKNVIELPEIYYLFYQEIN